MVERYGKLRKQYVYHPWGESRICLIRGPGHYSVEWKILEDFDAKYSKGKPPKYHSNCLVQGKKNNRKQEKNTIFNNMVDEILLNKTQKVSTAREAEENFDYDYDENDLYHVEKEILEDTKEKIEWHRR